MLGQIKHSWFESGGVYGYRKIHLDLREAGEACGKHRVARLTRSEGLRSQTGYRRRPGHYNGKPAVVSPNHLDRQVKVPAPNVAWVTNITYIRTYEGWLYLFVVIALFSRQVVGWSMKPRMTSDLALDALLAAVWRSKPQGNVMVHSDQGSQFSSGDWQIYPTREAARQDVFNYIEMFYNPRRRHGTSGDLSPVEFEKRHYQSLASV